MEESEGEQSDGAGERERRVEVKTLKPSSGYQLDPKWVETTAGSPHGSTH